MIVNRMEKIDELIKNELALEIRELFPEKFISITQVRVSKDLGYAKVWISTTIELEEVVKLCHEKSSQIRKDLSKKVHLRKMPKLHFVADYTAAEADKIERLIRKIED